MILIQTQTGQYVEDDKFDYYEVDKGGVAICAWRIVDAETVPGITLGKFDTEEAAQEALDRLVYKLCLKRYLIASGAPADPNTMLIKFADWGEANALGCREAEE